MTTHFEVLPEHHPSRPSPEQDDVDLFLLLAAAATSALGVLGGLGGAVFLVPALVLTRTAVANVAPLGLLTVAASSSA